jgi:predicted HTH domain antitoxin
MKTLRSVRVPDEFVASEGGEREAQQAITKLTVVALVRSHVISVGKGAELAGMDRWDFDALLAEHGVPSLELEADEVSDQARPL